MAKKATAKRRKFVVKLLNSAVKPGALTVSSPEIFLHSIDEVALAALPLLEDPQGALVEYNDVFKDDADWGRVEDVLSPFAAWCEKNGDKLDLKELSEKQRQCLRAIIRDSDATKKLIRSGELTWGEEVTPTPKYQKRLSIGGSRTVVYSSPQEMLFSPENFGWEKSQPTRFGPMIFALVGNCGFTIEHHTFACGDGEKIGEFLARRFDPFLSMVQVEAPHLNLLSKHPFPSQLKKWVKENVRGVGRFDNERVVAVLLDALHNMGLVNVDPGCGGVVLNSYAYEVMVNPIMYAQLLWQSLPSFVSNSDRSIAILDALIAYLGGPEVAEAMGVKPIELYSTMRTFAADTCNDDARQAMEYNYIVRCILGIQKAKFSNFTDRKQLSDIGSLAMRYGLAKNVDREAAAWVQMRSQLRAS